MTADIQLKIDAFILSALHDPERRETLLELLRRQGFQEAPQTVKEGRREGNDRR